MVTDDKQTDKAPTKPFMTVGPTLHYSHKNVIRCWLFALGVFGLSCLFWTKIQTGSFWGFEFEMLKTLPSWDLSRYVVNGVNIFEYPWQILVLGLVMGILGIVPVLMSQLMSFSYSVPFILAVLVLADLPGLAISLLISSLGAACRPLRFRSRFIAIALCTAPQLLYWGYFGYMSGTEPIKLGFSFAPWLCAWIVSMAIAGAVLGIGHFTRYRPGLVWLSTAVVILAAAGLFELEIGFDELDYQLYIAKNNPKNIIEFRDHSITELLDKTITEPSLRVRRYLESSFLPTEPIQLRAELKERLQGHLRFDRWPSWFNVPPQLLYQAKRQSLVQQYDLFIKERVESRRMPIALYYTAILSEYSPDIRLFEQQEILHFYSDYPFERSQDIWYWLYTEFGDSPESIEARWRIATHWARQGRFEQAGKLLDKAERMLSEQLTLQEKDQPPKDTLFDPFCPPAESAITASDLAGLQIKIMYLHNLLSPQNRTKAKSSGKRLAKFLSLNPHNRFFSGQLDQLLKQMGKKDPLFDNVVLAKTKLIADEQLRAESLSQLHKKFKKTDGGMLALYESGLLKKRLWLQQDKSAPEQKKIYLAETRAILTSFISLYADAFCIEQVKKMLDNLPTVE